MHIWIVRVILASKRRESTLDTTSIRIILLVMRILLKVCWYLIILSSLDLLITTILFSILIQWRKTKLLFLLIIEANHILIRSFLKLLSLLCVRRPT